MGRFIVKHTVEGKELYLVWSSIVDAPVTSACSLDGLKGFWRQEYGRVGIEDLERDIASGPGWCRPLSEVVECNRAGENETRMTLEQIVDFYFVRRCVGTRPHGRPSWTGW